jgi:tetratricopeptide (TPR) repeat protein
MHEVKVLLTAYVLLAAVTCQPQVRYRTTSNAGSTKKVKETPEKLRSDLSVLMDQGRINDVLSYLDDIESTYGSLYIDNKLPSLFTYRGVALHNAQRMAEAEVAFTAGLSYFPNDTRSWINLGEAQTTLFKLNDAIASFTKCVVHSMDIGTFIFQLLFLHFIL